MKKRLIFKNLLFLTVLLLLSFNNISHAQNNFLDMDQDMIKVFEEKATYLKKVKQFNLKKEQSYIDDVLKTKEQAVEFSKFIMNCKFPNYDKNNEFLYYVDEDKTNKLWFIYLRSPYSFVGNGTFLIIIKNNCKIIYLDKTK